MAARHRVLVVAAAVALAACGGGQGEADDTTRSLDSTATSDPITTTTHPIGDTRLVARADSPVAIHPTPGSAPDHTLAATTEFGSPRALLVLQDQGEWLQVALPERPNGSTGWILRDSVELRPVDVAIQIDLGRRTLTLWDSGVAVLTTPVAIGTPDAPTPTGQFYVVDKLATDDPGGAYGPFAFGLSAHSEVLTEFAGGDGQVGVHGTNDPGSIGEAVSHGCIRVPNAVSETLNQLVELGTPVMIS